VIGLGPRNPRKKERKKERDRKKERKEKWLIGCSPFALSPVIRLGLQNPRKKEKKKGGKGPVPLSQALQGFLIIAP